MSLLDKDISKLSSSELTQLYTNLQLPITAATTTLNNISTTISTPIILQLVDIENIAKSRLNRLDDLLGSLNPNDVQTDKLRNKNAKKPPRKKIIRNVDMEDQQDTAPKLTSCYYKFTLMDYKGNLAFGCELTKLSFLSGSESLLPIPLGSKIVVKPGTKVVGGILMLTTELTSLGGGSFGEPEGLENVIIRKLKMELESFG